MIILYFAVIYPLRSTAKGYETANPKRTVVFVHAESFRKAEKKANKLMKEKGFDLKNEWYLRTVKLLEKSKEEYLATKNFENVVE